MGYKSRANWETGLARCLDTCKCLKCRKKKEEKEKNERNQENKD